MGNRKISRVVWKVGKFWVVGIFIIFGGLWEEGQKRVIFGGFWGSALEFNGRFLRGEVGLGREHFSGSKGNLMGKIEGGLKSLMGIFWVKT